MKRAALIIVLGLAACSAPAAAGTSWDLHDGSIEGPDRIGAGAATLEVSNEGAFNHTLVVTDEQGEVIAATGLVEPGAETQLQVDLDSGVYSFSCRIVVQDDEGNLIDHYEMGMHRTVTVR